MEYIVEVGKEARKTGIGYCDARTAGEQDLFQLSLFEDAVARV